MPCKSCQSGNQRTFQSEINIQFPRIDEVTKPNVWAFPNLIICLDCGFAEFELAQPELHRLAEGKRLDPR